MQPFQTVNQDELLDSLTNHYQHYREMIDMGGSEEEFLSCRTMLLAILEELNYRRKFWKETDRTRGEFSFEREPDL